MLLKNKAAIRKQLFAVERGHCQECRLDTQAVLTRLRCHPATKAGRARRLQTLRRMAEKWFTTEKRRKAAERLAKHPHQGDQGFSGSRDGRSKVGGDGSGEPGSLQSRHP